PLKDLLRHNTREVVLTALIFVGNNAAGYLVIAYFLTYGTNVLDLDRSSVLTVIVLASVGWLASTMWGGMLSDRIGRVRTFQLGPRDPRPGARVPVRTAVGAVRRDVPRERALLGGVDRLRLRRDPRRRVRPHDRRTAGAGHRVGRFGRPLHHAAGRGLRRGRDDGQGAEGRRPRRVR